MDGIRVVIKGSWKEPIEVGKLGLKFESTTQVGKWLMKFENLN